jgi:hypothetical protein
MSVINKRTQFEQKVKVRGEKIEFLKASRLLLDNSMVKKKKGKAIPLQTWTGPERSRRLPYFKTIGTWRW